MKFVLLTIVIIIGLLIYFFKDETSIFLQQKNKEQEKKRLPFKRKDFLLNIPERIFFESLQQIIPINYVVFPQILLSAIVNVYSSRKRFWSYQNKINRKTVDFVVFEKQYLKPVIAIEYDGKTHDRKDRQKRDTFVNGVLESAGIKSLHIKHQENINFKEIQDKINQLLSPPQGHQIISDNKVYEVQKNG